MNKFSLEPSKSPHLYANRNASYDGPSVSRQEMSRLSILSPKNFYESPDNSVYGASPQNMMSARNSPLKMFSTLQNFHPQPHSAKNNSINKRELEALLYENKGSVLASILQKDKTKGISDTARIEAYFKIDYGKKGIQKQGTDDVEDVKRLDEWQLALKRHQGKDIINQPNNVNSNGQCN